MKMQDRVWDASETPTTVYLKWKANGLAGSLANDLYAVEWSSESDGEPFGVEKMSEGLNPMPLAVIGMNAKIVRPEVTGFNGRFSFEDWFGLVAVCNESPIIPNRDNGVFPDRFKNGAGDEVVDIPARVYFDGLSGASRMLRRGETAIPFTPLDIRASQLNAEARVEDLDLGICYSYTPAVWRYPGEVGNTHDTLYVNFNGLHRTLINDTPVPVDVWFANGCSGQVGTVQPGHGLWLKAESAKSVGLGYIQENGLSDFVEQFERRRT